MGWRPIVWFVFILLPHLSSSRSRAAEVAGVYSTL